MKSRALNRGSGPGWAHCVFGNLGPCPCWSASPSTRKWSTAALLSVALGCVSPMFSRCSPPVPVRQRSWRLPAPHRGRHQSLSRIRGSPGRPRRRDRFVGAARFLIDAQPSPALHGATQPTIDPNLGEPTSGSICLPLQGTWIVTGNVDCSLVSGGSLRRRGGGSSAWRASRIWPVACVLSAAICLLTACTNSSPPDADESVQSTSPPPTPSAAATLSGALAAPLSAPEYRNAVRDFARSDTGRFELVAVAEDGADDTDLAAFPRARGTWRLSTSEAESSTRVMNPEGETVELAYRMVDRQSYFRIAFDGSAFGGDCWAKIDTDAPYLADSPMAGQQLGLPPAVHLVDGYRPEGRPQAGTARLDDVLGAIGFQKLVNTNLALLRQARTPVEVQLQEGRFHRVLIYPADLVDAVDDLDGGLPELEPIEEMLNQVPLMAWGIEYSGLGDTVTIAAPPKDTLLDFGNPGSKCGE